MLEGTLYSERTLADAKIHDAQHCTVTSSTVPMPCKFTPNPDRQIAVSRGRDDSRCPRAPNTAMYCVPWLPAGRREFDAVHHLGSSDSIARATPRSSRSTRPSCRRSAVVSYARQGVISQQRIELADRGDQARGADGCRLSREPDRSRRSLGAARPLARHAQGWRVPEHTTAELDLRVDLDASRLVMRAFPTSRSCSRAVTRRSRSRSSATTNRSRMPRSR